MFTSISDPLDLSLYTIRYIKHVKRDFDFCTPIFIRFCYIIHLNLNYKLNIQLTCLSFYQIYFESDSHSNSNLNVKISLFRQLIRFLRTIDTLLARKFVINRELF